MDDNELFQDSDLKSRNLGNTTLLQEIDIFISFILKIEDIKRYQEISIEMIRKKWFYIKKRKLHSYVELGNIRTKLALS